MRYNTYMHYTKSSSLAWGLSLTLHIVFLGILSTFNALPEHRASKEMTLTYFKVNSKSLSLKKEMPVGTPLKGNDLTALGQRLILSDRNNIPAKKAFVYENARKESLLKPENYLQKPNIQRAEFIDKNALKLPHVEMEPFYKQSQSPAYLTYSNYLHERYRHCLYARYSDTIENGLVSLKFALNADGSLAEYRVIDEKSDASDLLKRIATGALGDAAPFPPLPKELGASVLTFKVSIHFAQVKEE